MLSFLIKMGVSGIEECSRTSCCVSEGSQWVRTGLTATVQWKHIKQRALDTHDPSRDLDTFYRYPKVALEAMSGEWVWCEQIDTPPPQYHSPLSGPLYFMGLDWIQICACENDGKASMTKEGLSDVWHKRSVFYMNLFSSEAISRCKRNFICFGAQEKIFIQNLGFVLLEHELFSLINTHEIRYDVNESFILFSRA